MKIISILIISILGFLSFSACHQNEPENKTVAQPTFVRHTPLHPVLPYDEPDTSTGKLFDILSAKKTGLHFSNDLKLSFKHNYFEFINLFIGAGVATGDFNNDGLQDIFFSGSIVEDKIFINKSGLVFEEISETALPAHENGASTGVTIVDINNDGYDDIYVCRTFYPDESKKRQNKFLINNKNLTFSDKAAAYGLADSSFSIHASFFDYDNDGDLDMYLLNHPIDWNDRNKLNNYEKIGEGSNRSDKLFRNNSNGTFTDVSLEAGINNHGYGLSVTTADFNNDGWTDVYVSNDWAMHDHLYINQQNGSFKDESREQFQKFSYSSMGSDAADFNNDGHFDIVTVEMDYSDNLLHKAYVHTNPPLSRIREMQQSGYHTQYFHNALHLNNGNGNFIETAHGSNISSTDWSWACFFVDFDHDGWEDLFITNGNYRQANRDERPTIKTLKDALRRKDSALYEQTVAYFDTVHTVSSNPFFKNNGDLTFEDMTTQWGSNYPCISNGAAYADFDNDGDIDIVTNNVNETALVYKNKLIENSKSDNNYLLIEFKGSTQNRQGIGTKIMASINGKRQFRQLISTRGSQSSSEKIIHLGVGASKKIDTLLVEWPSGKTQLLKHVKVNRKINLDIKNAKPSSINIASLVHKTTPLFENKTKESGIVFQHMENEYDDLLKQKLLPHMLSRSGPGIAVGDINSDGMDDFVVGGASKHPANIFYQTKNARFNLISSPTLDKDAIHEDMGMLLIDVDNDGDNDLYIASGGSEFPQASPQLKDRLYLNDGNGNFTKTSNWLPDMAASSSCVIAADFNGDDKMDLFIGGRLSPGSYPEAGQSVLLKNTGSSFEDVTAELAPGLTHAGMVNAAIWTDYDNDLDPDLMLAGEWMPIQIFQNNNGQFTPIKSSTLQVASGWWNGIASLDFDKDGDTDYVVTNHGENSRIKPLPGSPLQIYFDDFDNDGDIDPVMSYFQAGKEYPFAHLEDLAAGISFVGQKFKSYTRYGMAELKEVMGAEKLHEAKKLEAATFESILLENTGNDNFKIHQLPPMAQFSTLFGIVTQDFDGDGHIDILMHGNFHKSNVQFEKQDACNGIFLKGNGTPDFKAIPAAQSGFFQNREGRSLATILLQNKQLPILASLNNDHLKLYNNINSNSEIKVLNPVTTQAIVHFKNGKKAKYEFYPGNGYLSQHSKAIFVPQGKVEKIIQIPE